MEEKNNQVIKAAMLQGLQLGGFWIFKYTLFIIGTFFPLFSYSSIILAPVTIAYAYMLTSIYKVVIGGKISFSLAWKFGILLYFFASLIEAIPQYIFYRYIASPEYMSAIIEQVGIFVKNMNVSPEVESEVISTIAGLTPIQYTIQGIITNIIYGIILSIPIAAIQCRFAVESEYKKTNKTE
ncbi:MAG: DUF4199 domain-containing protein [Tannerellaceae bacterium]|jgi:hypothetical protein|nr:DUF4199 domain-containing protein [Tannerellaceae bacterium]